MRRPSALLAALTGVLVAGPLASVGHAEAGTTLSDLVTTEAGHVTGTVTTSAPYVRLVLRSSQGSVAHSVSAVPADTGAYDFDLETWVSPTRRPWTSSSARPPRPLAAARSRR